MASESPSPSRKNISDIKSSLLRPALTSHFQCWFNPPTDVRKWVDDYRVAAGLGDGYTPNSDFFSLSCSEASLPGSSLATHELNNDFTGVTERRAYRRLYDDRADFTFYVDHDHNIIKFFENWLSYIVNEQYTEGLVMPNYFYRVNYPDGTGEPGSGYRTTIYVNKFERDYQDRYTSYKFLQAYPIAINSMPLSYDASSLLKCTVSFTYTRYALAGEFNTDKSTTSFVGSVPTPQQQAVLNGSSFGFPPGTISNTNNGIFPFTAGAAGLSLQQSFGA